MARTNRLAEMNTSRQSKLSDWITKGAMNLVLAHFQKIELGQLFLHYQGRQYSFGREHKDFPNPINLQVHHHTFFTKLISGGTIGSAEAYMKSAWSCDQLTDLVRLLIRNRKALLNVEKIGRWTGGLAHWLTHRLRGQSRRASRDNIAAHYDLGNDFFELFLDESMTYSSAIFRNSTQSLADAQREKLHRLCQKLDLRPGDHLLEVGTGWGSLALHAAREFGCHVTTTTISRRQFELARHRVKEAGLQNQITLLHDDYRDLKGQYDKLVSVEMIEAIGPSQYNKFFGQCGQLLKPEGMMVLQSITICDDLYSVARREVDFIQRYIFPGSCIPSISALASSVGQSSDLTMTHLEDIGPHYAVTLKHWRERLQDRRDDARKLGYSNELLRLWDFYFSYCEAGFLERNLGDVQMVLAKPRCPVQPLLGDLSTRRTSRSVSSAALTSGCNTEYVSQAGSRT